MPFSRAPFLAAAAALATLFAAAPALAHDNQADGRVADRYFPRHLNVTGPLPTIYGMNNGSTVIASYLKDFDYYRPQPHRRFWQSAEEALPLLPQGTAGVPLAINDAHDAVGWVRVGAQTRQGWRAVRWPAAGGVVDLATALPPGISAAHGINASGQAVGSFAEAHDTQAKTVIWSPDGQPSFLDPLPNVSMLGRAINDAGQVAGLLTKGGFFDHPTVGTPGGFFWSPETGLHRFSPASDVTAINERGQVVGGAADITRTSHAFVWDVSMGRRVQKLPILPDYRYCDAKAISNDGVVVGSCTRSTGGGGLFWRKPVAWEKVGDAWRVVDLSQRVKGGDNLHEHDHLVAVAIDAAGQILLNMESGGYPLEPSILVPLGQ